MDGDPDQHVMLCKVPVFRPVASKLLQLLANEEASVLEVALLLKSDPGFSAEVLTMANSAAHGSAHRVHTIERAVVLLGLERTKGLVTRVALGGMVRGLGASPAIQNCWRHSLATAIIARWLGPFYELHPDLVYTNGLMHDVGRLGLLGAEPKEYPNLLGSVHGTGEDVLMAERWAFRVDHCQAGLFLAKTWGLPEEFWQPAAEHHAPRNPATSPSVDIIRLACAMADALGYMAAPMIQSEKPEVLLEQVPNLAHANIMSPLSVLSQLLENELGEVSVATEGTGRPQSSLVN